jgi:hypothetical protein
MTTERIAARDALMTRAQELETSIRDYSNSFEDRQRMKAELEQFLPQVQVFSIMAEADRKLQEITPFIGLYQGLKPDVIKVIATGVDEALDIFIQVANTVTKYNELRTLMAQSTRRTFEAYVAVGFEPEQAFALTLRTMEVMDEAVKNSFRNVKLEKK